MRQVMRDVQAFMELGQPDQVGDFENPKTAWKELRKRLIREEAEELCRAIDEDDLPEIADGCCDLVYVTVGTAITCGIDLEPQWAEVQRSNMSKFPVCQACGGSGVTRSTHAQEQCNTCGGCGHVVLRDAGGKVLKPPGWTAPRNAAVLDASVRAYREGDGRLVRIADPEHG